jgi:hypothetical protein
MQAMLPVILKPDVKFLPSFQYNSDVLLRIPEITLRQSWKTNKILVFQLGLPKTYLYFESPNVTKYTI